MEQNLTALELLPKKKWAAGFPAEWQPGEAGAAKRLKHFAARAMEEYSKTRNFPDRDGTSRLSPWLQCASQTFPD